jgi:hypothetical protein
MKRITYTKYVPDPSGEMSMEVEPFSERRAGSPLAKSGGAAEGTLWP